MNKLFGTLAIVAGLSACTSMVQPFSGTQSMEIRNETGSTMTQFYAKHPQEDVWGKDRLGNSVLNPGSRITIDFGNPDDECIFNLRAVFANGDVRVADSVDVCSQAKWEYN